MIERVITGGQTGVDQAALRGAKRCGIPTGGYCPTGCYTEEGRRPDLIAEFGLIEMPGTYAARTGMNVLSCDAVLILAWVPGSPGTRLTRNLARRFNRPFYFAPKNSLPDIEARIYRWLVDADPRILMVAGNRESVAPGIGAWAETLLCSVFHYLKIGGVPSPGSKT